MSDEAAHYYSVDLRPGERNLVLDALRAFDAKTRSALLAEVERRLLTATRVDLPLPKDGLADELAEAEAEAERRGGDWTVADVLAERMGKAREPS